jgi:hypothetical protein
MKPKVVNLHIDKNALQEWGTVYIGRSFKKDVHFGNPFSHLPAAQGITKVPTRQDAIKQFEDWLSEKKYLALEPDRRHWIQKNLWRIRQAKKIACYCHPLACHGDVLVKFALDKKLH